MEKRLTCRRVFSPSSRRAFVAAQPFVFGIARMAQTYLDDREGIVPRPRVPRSPHCAEMAPTRRQRLGPVIFRNAKSLSHSLTLRVIAIPLLCHYGRQLLVGSAPIIIFPCSPRTNGSCSSCPWHLF